MTPLIASFWYGLVASAEAVGPVLLYHMFWQNKVNSVKRNDAYKYAWYIMWVGGLIVYAPLAVLCPISYISGEFLSSSYLSLWGFLHSGIGFALHFSVLLMLWYAGRMYLYESSLSNNDIQLELSAYSAVIFGLFWMTTNELKLPFY